ncbi:S8 family serine peptidase [bacterium]|nr:S8 family serine peptidase [bacterium]
MFEGKKLKIFSFFVCLFFISGVGIFSQKKDKISHFLQDLIEKKTESSLTAWVYFKDKGPHKFQRLQEVRESLTLQSLKRRRRCGMESLVDEYDIPVYKPYLQSIKPYLTKVRHESRWLNAVSVEASGEALRQIAELTFVEKIEKVKVYTFREPSPKPPSGPKRLPPEAKTHLYDYGPSFFQLNQMDVPKLHDRGYTGEGVLVCMLDSGFNHLDHAALDHIDIRATWDFVNQDPRVFDEEGMGNGDHGTNTLGAIAGFQPGQLIGPAFRASFILGKTENTEWERHMEEDHWVAGAEWADSLGADIISSSLGYRNRFTHGESDYTSEDMDGETTVVAQGANIAASRGILIVNSAGNEGASNPPDNTLVSPSDSPEVLAVGAVNSQGVRVYFSSTGPTSDGRIKPDVMAQGQSVYSAKPEGTDEYEYVSGSSFSCPLTAGAAALLLEINPSWSNKDIREAVKLTAGQSHSPDNRRGWGLVDAFDAAFYPLKNIHAPDEFALQRVENHYGFFIQYVDQLSWTSDPRNGNRVQSYRIYALRLGEEGQTFVQIAEVDASTFHFTRRGLLEEETFLYKIVSVDTYGRESDPTYARI